MDNTIKQPPKEKLSYRERNGTTRVGDALRWLKDQGKEIAPSLLNIAGTITNIEGLNGLADTIKGEKSLTDLDKKMLLEQLEIDKTEMEEITKRWEADMNSDSWASKNIRPYATAATLFFSFVLIVLDSAVSSFSVKEHWVTLLMTLLSTMVVALFGSRGLEKIKKVAGKTKK